MMRSAALQRCGGYSSRHEPAEDFELWLRLSNHGDLANLPDIVLHYRSHPAATTIARAKANARAAALALLCHRHGDNTARSAPLSARETDWSEVERALSPACRLFARAAYLRALILNGGIVAEPELQLLHRSLPQFLADPLLAGRRDVIAFMIVRAARQCVASNALGGALALLLAGLRHLPGAVALETGASLARRLAPAARWGREDGRAHV